MEKLKKRFERIPLDEVRKLVGEPAGPGAGDLAQGVDQVGLPKPAPKGNHLAKAAAAATDGKKS